jgi:hypothetical protein
MTGMKKSGYFRVAVAWLAVGGMCIPQVAFAATPNRPNSAIADIALRDGGVLLGQVVKSDGSPVSGAPIALRNGSQEVAAGATNAGGYFAFSGLNSGTYQVATTGGAATYQVWTKDVAPPVAQPGALLVTNGDTVRGQNGALRNFLTNPLVIAGIVATAIAVPVALSNSNRHHSSVD